MLRSSSSSKEQQLYSTRREYPCIPDLNTDIGILRGDDNRSGDCGRVLLPAACLPFTDYADRGS